MNDRKPDEKKFEEEIEKGLNFQGFKSISADKYNRRLCLIEDEVIGFIKSSQKENWNELGLVYQEQQMRLKILEQIASDIRNRGVIDCLRKPIKCNSHIDMNLVYFKPKSGMNPEHKKLYKKNRFSLVRQLRYSTRSESSIDMVLFLNGIPILTIELKNQLTNQDIQYAERQYRDRDSSEPLLEFKRCLAHFCLDNDLVSMTTQLQGERTRFFPYNQNIEEPATPKGYKTEYLWQDILAPDSLLDIIDNFVQVIQQKEHYFDARRKEVQTRKFDTLVFPRYHQLDLIRKLRDTVRKDGVGTNYLIQHATGSGKSLSIGWLAHTLSSLYKSKSDNEKMFDTVAVVTDRTVLDDQLGKTLQDLQRMHGVVNRSNNSKQLKKNLEDGKSVIVTTIQKFPVISNTISRLSQKTFGVIIDEVHSSQSGELSKEMKRALSTLNIEIKNDEDLNYEDYIREEIKNKGKQKHISFFGFSGTPKEITLQLFGTKDDCGMSRPFHCYSMHQSINEKFTLDVLANYTTYKRYFRVVKTTPHDMLVSISEGTKKILKSVDSHKFAITGKVKIILDHFIRKASKEIKGRSRGMIVAASRQECIQYFKEVDKQLKEAKKPYRALVSFSGEVSYEKEKHTENSLNKTVDHTGNIPLGFKNPKYRLLIVSNKFLTGFDEPLLQSMYIDKKIDGIQCVQTLSRLNRTITGKNYTFVLDFVNKIKDIERSFQRFYKSTILSGETNFDAIYDIQRQIKEFDLFTQNDIDEFCNIFYQTNRDEGVLQHHLNQVVHAWEKIGPAGQEKFRILIQNYIRWYGYLSQITLRDIELEKLSIFLTYVNRKLPKRPGEQEDITRLIDLDSFKMQKQDERENVPMSTDTEDIIAEPSEISFPPVHVQDSDLLSDLISRLNERFGQTLFNSDDKIPLEEMRNQLIQDKYIREVMTTENSDEDRKDRVWEKLDDQRVDYVDKNPRFYEKTKELDVKQFIYQALYDLLKKELKI